MRETLLAKFGSQMGEQNFLGVLNDLLEIEFPAVNSVAQPAAGAVNSARAATPFAIPDNTKGHFSTSVSIAQHPTTQITPVSARPYIVNSQLPVGTTTSAAVVQQRLPPTIIPRSFSAIDTISASTAATSAPPLPPISAAPSLNYAIAPTQPVFAANAPPSLRQQGSQIPVANGPSALSTTAPADAPAPAAWMDFQQMQFHFCSNLSPSTTRTLRQLVLQNISHLVSGEVLAALRDVQEPVSTQSQPYTITSFASKWSISPAVLEKSIAL